MNLFTPEQVRLARQHVADDPVARKTADAIFKSAAPWLERESDAIRHLMPDAFIPRTRHITPGTFTVNYATGCPVHDRPPEDFEGYSQWEWIYDPFKDRWRITCPVGGETYPSNDFEAFYQTRDRSLLTGPYPDDGYGWRPDGSPYRFWFIGYCGDAMWRTVMGGLTALSRAYLLGGDARYAHKALVILDRLAEVYPDMDHSKQSMYAVDLSPGYDGKMFNLIAETGTVRQLCEALDAVRDAIPSDPVYGPTAGATLSKLERGIIGASIEGVYTGQVRGNYGMHQEALLFAAIASGDQVEIHKAVEWVLNNTGEATRHKEMLTSFDDYIFRDRAAHAEGLNFALDNLHFREGIGWESSPSYNGSWIGHLTVVAALLDRLGVRVWDRPGFRRMYRWPVEMTCLDRFTPAIGDSGGIGSGLAQPGAAVLRTAYAATGDPLIGELLRKHNFTFNSFDSLFEEPATPPSDKGGAAEIKRLTASSHLLGGYGLALLRSGRGKERTAVSLYYGRAATEHAHFDRLTLELFGYSRKLIPDLGYGDHASEGDPPAVWTKNTASHATVVVDERRQDTQAPGRLSLFTSTDGLNLVEVNAPDTYHHTSEYRRTVALIDIAPDARYVLDLFRVAGGDQHDYSLHGFDGDFSTSGIALSPQAAGTLAGEDVPFGDIYDDEALKDPVRKGRTYYTYRGSGYSYLYNVQRGHPDGVWSAAWTDAELNIGLRTTFLPSDGAVVAQGKASRRAGNPDALTYILLRNSGDGIASQFAAVLEPFAGAPKVHIAEQVERTDCSTALKIRHQHGEDTLSHTVSPTGTTFSLVRRDPDGKLIRLDQVGPGSVRADGHTLTIEKSISGSIVSVDPHTSTIHIERDANSQPLRRALIGETIHIHNGRRTTPYTISSIEGRPACSAVRRAGRGSRIGLNNESFRIGRFLTTGINADGSGLSTKTCLYLASQGYYRGARLVDETHAVWLPVEDVKLSPHRPKSRRDGSIALVGNHDLHAHFTPGQIAYLYDFGPGDAVSITPRATALRRTDGTFRIKGNCRAVLSA